MAQMHGGPTIRLCFDSSMRPQHPGPAILLDRDGVINQRVSGGYVTDWNQFEFVPGIVRSLIALSVLRVPIVVLSNQACVGKRLLTRRTLAGITRRFVALLRAAGARIDAVYYCPHTPDSHCGCRKPRSGMLERAARDFSIDLQASVFVGDSPSDARAAIAVGCMPIVLLGRQSLSGPYPGGSEFIHSTEELFPAISKVVDRDRGRVGAS